MNKIIAVSLIIILVANMVLFAMGRTSPLLFWIILGLAALTTYIGKKYKYKDKH